MRQMILCTVAALVAVTASDVPAKACGLTPCEQTFVPTFGYSGCARGCSTGWGHERLAEPTTQYYYVNQGPTYTGPGAFAPYQTYQEGAVSGWTGYQTRRYHHGYDGGRYASPMTHDSEGAGLEGPAVYSYRWQRPAYRYGHAPRVHPGMRYGYALHHYYHGHPVLRRYY